MSRIKFKPRRITIAGQVPTIDQLENGEFAINTADQKIFQRVGSSVIAVGVGLDMSGRVEELWQPFLLIFGMLCVVSSAFGACWGYYKTLMKDNTLLLLNTYGIVWQTDDSSASIPWKDLVHVEQRSNMIILESAALSISIPKSFVGITPKRLIETITSTQKKVLLGVVQ